MSISSVPQSMSQKLALAIELHQAGKLKRAEAIYRKILAKRPKNDEALHLLGVLLHQTGRNGLAEQFIQRAIKLAHENDTYIFNLAEVQRASEQLEAAVVNYRKAIAIESNEADYYYGLGNALFDTGEPKEAVAVFRQAALLAPHDSQIHNNLGNALWETGLHDEAIESYRVALSLQPHIADSYYNLATALDDCGVIDEAIENYQHAISLNPDMPVAFSNLGRLQREQGRLAEAEQSYRQALLLNPILASALLGLGYVYRDIGDYLSAVKYYRILLENDPEHAKARSLLGDCLAKLDMYDEAREQINKALQLEPDSAENHFNLATCLQALGRFDEATESHRRALTLKPDFSVAAYNLVMINSQSLSDEELANFDRLSGDEALDENTRINLHFALAKAYHDRRRYEHAFLQLKSGNNIKAASNPFDPEVFISQVDRVIATHSTAFFEARWDFGIDSEMPVFIVGMPRSGSTLVEQIISSHPLAHGAGELNDMRILSKKLPEILGSNLEDPEILVQIPKKLCRSLAAEHLKKLGGLSEGAVRVCDKMLGNFLKLGLIYMMFPQARIIHCRRNPLDMGISCYFQNFARGLRFSYDLEHLGIAYRGYRKLMDHWQSVLPMRMLDVSYEQLIAKQEDTSRKLIDFCGLDWDENCLDFHRQQRGVKTASFWQVRQPIYQSSVSRWQHYEKHLQPLIEALGDDLDDCALNDG